MNTEIKAETGAKTRPEDRVRAGERFVTPNVDIYETGDAYTLLAELPGVGREGLHLTVEGNELTLLGRRENNGLNSGALWRESLEADYRRVFELNPAIDARGIEAKLEQGFLTVRLPKSERAKPRKITVEG